MFIYFCLEWKKKTLTSRLQQMECLSELQMSNSTIAATHLLTSTVQEHMYMKLNQIISVKSQSKSVYKQTIKKDTLLLAKFLQDDGGNVTDFKEEDVSVQVTLT